MIMPYLNIKNVYGSINTKLEGTAAYSTLRENTDHSAVEIMGLATIAQPLIIYLKLV